MYTFLAIQIAMLCLVAFGGWQYIRQSRETHRISRNEVHGLRNDLNAAHLKIEHLTAENAELRSTIRP